MKLVQVYTRRVHVVELSNVEMDLIITALKIEATRSSATGKQPVLTELIESLEEAWKTPA